MCAHGNFKDSCAACEEIKGDIEETSSREKDLKNFDASKNPEGLDLDATKKIFKDFSREFKDMGGIIEGKAHIRLDNGRYAFIDQAGAIISKEYKFAYSYSEGKACVLLDNGKYAFIDHDGNIVSKEYKHAKSYFEGKARVQLDTGEWVFIDHDEEIIHFKE